MFPNNSFWVGAAAGAAAMYLLDPKDGPRRRELAAEQARRIAEEPAVQKVAGTVIDVTRPLHDQGPGSDPALVDKVRSEVLGRDEFQGLHLNVGAHDGTITLRGEVPGDDLRASLVRAVRGVGGVTEVTDLMHAPGQVPPNMAPSS